VGFETLKLVAQLSYPISHVIVLSLIALILFWSGARGKAAFLLMVSIGWLWLASTAFFADWLMGTLEDTYRPKALSVSAEADAILVLGGATRGDTHFSSLGDMNQQADRLLHAVRLFQAGKAPVIVLSGGARPGARPEAQLMQEILQVMGVPEEAIVTEEASRDTYENALYSRTVLSRRGIERVLLVTSAFHMRRAEAVFRAQGFDVIPSPTDYQRLVAPPLIPRWLPTADDLDRTTRAIHEYVGYFAYSLRGRL
jgi:uncharacterized SAM-binding protein YcdF (DUF218 family)